MNKKLDHKELLKAGVHFGHLTRKWNPKMSEYIFMQNNITKLYFKSLSRYNFSFTACFNFIVPDPGV